MSELFSGAVNIETLPVAQLLNIPLPFRQSTGSSVKTLNFINLLGDEL